MRITSIGWWGIPGTVESKRSKVHAVCDDKPICGQKMHPDSKYQWCAPRLEHQYLECAKCKKIINRKPPLESVIRSLRDAARSLVELTVKTDNPRFAYWTELLIQEIKESERVVELIGPCATIKMKKAPKTLREVKIVSRPEWTPKSSQTDRRLVQEGCERIGGRGYIRLVRWNRRRRAFVLEALVLNRTRLLRKVLSTRS